MGARVLLFLFLLWGISRWRAATGIWLARICGRHFVSTRLPRFARNDNVIRVYAWFYNVNPYKSPLTPLKFVIPRERSDRGNLAGAETVASATNGIFYLFVYDCFRFFRRGFLDFARNDNVYKRFFILHQRICGAFLVCPLVFNVISTGVRTTVRTQWRNPPRQKYEVRVHIR